MVCTGNTEYDAVRNDPKIKFTKCSGLISYGGSEVKKELVGFVGKVYMGGKDDPDGWYRTGEPIL